MSHFNDRLSRPTYSASSFAGGLAAGPGVFSAAAFFGASALTVADVVDDEPAADCWLVPASPEAAGGAVGLLAGVAVAFDSLPFELSAAAALGAADAEFSDAALAAGARFAAGLAAVGLDAAGFALSGAGFAPLPSCSPPADAASPVPVVEAGRRVSTCLALFTRSAVLAGSAPLAAAVSLFGVATGAGLSGRRVSTCFKVLEAPSSARLDCAASDLWLAAALLSGRCVSTCRVSTCVAPPDVTFSVRFDLLSSAELTAASGRLVSTCLAPVEDCVLEVSLPEVSLREVSLPEVSLPEVSLPEVSLPGVSLLDVSLLGAFTLVVSCAARLGCASSPLLSAQLVWVSAR